MREVDSASVFLSLLRDRCASDRLTVHFFLAAECQLSASLKRIRGSCVVGCGKGGVPSRVEIEKRRILPVGCSTTNRPSSKMAAGGMRHGEGYQEGGAAA